ncbi:Transmembrane emp24 domain-containing protein 4 [Desmophyllum pertusum]|uniref:Transmembrane emp24 domain-containing protein 4 n=1 Tax=Desmophyllum pertusum TaxID=174260 RepID=A0A9X0CP00_9CNID|nr:Transmembrane emp24 domain-containing protein 4 [Desmophyllum pertusum]
MAVLAWFALILVFFRLDLAHGLYFHMGETEKKCFIEEIPDETMVIGKYKTQLFDEHTGQFLPSSPGIGMHVEVKDPNMKVILSKYYASEGRFTFTSHSPGEHLICLHSNSTRWSLWAGGKLRIHLDIQVGEHANDYQEIAAKDKTNRAPASDSSIVRPSGTDQQRAKLSEVPRGAV